jgi:hypothetical protein
VVAGKCPGGRDDHVYVAGAIGVAPHLTQHAPDRPIGRHRIECRPDRAKPVTTLGVGSDPAARLHSLLPRDLRVIVSLAVTRPDIEQRILEREAVLAENSSGIECRLTFHPFGEIAATRKIGSALPIKRSLNEVARRIRRALPFTDPRNIIVCTHCGMKYLPRDVAFGKMKAMVDGASIVRRELQLGT